MGDPQFPATPPASVMYPNTSAMVDNPAPRPVPEPTPAPAAQPATSNPWPNSPLMRGADGQLLAPAAPAEAEQPAVEAPDVAAYAFDLPEGYTPDPDQLGRFKGLAVKHGLAPEIASDLVGLHAEVLRAEEVALEQEAAGWRTASEKLPEMQGDGRQAVARATALADRQTKAWLDASGLGNHPEFVRWAARVGRELGRLSGVKPGSLSARFYPNSPFMRD